ncbi:hypothetical protein AB6A40_008793 [Gnathostoma spinigerum]|uniref:Programmed cell death protein 10 dimerisation domain-containing protein n=1 Tax=Gnathostoma spinigerum TaxID=75299 RepID=A0ABD6EXU4_9BILA
MGEEGGYLGAMTFQCLFSGVIDKLIQARKDDPYASQVLSNLRSVLQEADATSPSFLFDFTKILLSDAGLNINLQVFMRFTSEPSSNIHALFDICQMSVS